MSAADFSIIWPRPDGWWCAGSGFDSEAEARDAAEAHNWGAQAGTWRIVPTSELPNVLCAEALASVTEENDQGEGA